MSTSVNARKVVTNPRRSELGCAAFASAATLACLLAACAAGTDSPRPSKEPAEQTDRSNTDPSDRESVAPPPVPPAPPPPPPPPPPRTKLYANTRTALYRLDPAGPTIEKVADFVSREGICTAEDYSGCIIDLAVSGEGKMYASSWSTLYTVDPATAKLTRLANGVFPNSLAVAPAGMVDPKEMLVGYDVDKFVRVDPASGARLDIGSLNPNRTGMNFVSSGDLVAMPDGTVLLTAQSVPEGPSDYLVQIDPTTGKVKKVVGQTGRYDLWGLGAIAGSLFAFGDGAQVFSLSVTNGAATTLGVTVPAGPAFWGGG